MTGPGFVIANRILAGTRLAVERVNDAGGLQGRMLELVTLDDRGDSEQLAKNVKLLARERGAVAILNCVGERACTAAAKSAAAEGVALVGPFSGDPALGAQRSSNVFMLRADHDSEAQALLKQLKSMVVSRVAFWGDGEEPLREQALLSALNGGGVEVFRVQGTGSAPPVLQGMPQALVLSLSVKTLADVAASHAPAGWPPLLLTTSGASLTQVTRLWRDRGLAFTSVVPNAEVSQLPLVRDFERALDKYQANSEAMTFEGLAAFMHTLALIEGMRRLSAGDKAAALPAAMERLGTLNLGGFVLQFSKNRDISNFVEFGVRSRDGKSRR